MFYVEIKQLHFQKVYVLNIFLIHRIKLTMCYSKASKTTTTDNKYFKNRVITRVAPIRGTVL